MTDKRIIKAQRYPLDLPEEIHTELKHVSIESGHTLNALIVSAIKFALGVEESPMQHFTKKGGDN